MIRSWLFVPGDSEKKLSRAFESSADALIFDWEDSVAEARKPVARALLPEVLKSREASGRPAIYVRINPVDSAHFEHDLAALPIALIDGVVVPKLQGPNDVSALSRRLDECEARGNGASTAKGRLGIVGIATEHAPAVLALTEFRSPLPRLQGLIWGAEDLGASMGVFANRDEEGRYRPVFRLARDLMLLAAGAAQCSAIDAVYVDHQDLVGLEQECRQARATGFTGKAAIHPAQVPIINECFSPTDEEVQWAHKVIAAMVGETGVATLDNKMIDAPHVKLARRILGRPD